MGLFRTVLALAVVVAHSYSLFGLSLIGGTVAVQSFFIISGFYMSLILNTKYTGKGSTWLFLSNRFLRLFPIYWVALFFSVALSAATIVIFHKWGPLEIYRHWIDILTPWPLLYLAVTNIILFGQDLLFFTGIDAVTGHLFFTSNFAATKLHLSEFLLIAPSWSLSIELMFYLIAPFVLRRKPLVVSLLIASLGIRIYIQGFLGWNFDPWTYRFFPTELAFFLAGALSYWTYDHFKDKPQLSQYGPTAMTTLLVLTVLYQFIPWEPAFRWVYYAVVATALPFLFAWTKLSPRDGRIGELSYPIYIAHRPLLRYLLPVLSTIGLPEIGGVVAVALTLVLATLLVKYVSDPIEKLRQARVKGHPVA